MSPHRPYIRLKDATSDLDAVIFVDAIESVCGGYGKRWVTIRTHGFNYTVNDMTVDKVLEHIAAALLKQAREDAAP